LYFVSKHFEECARPGSSLDFLTAGAICEKETASRGSQFFHLEGMFSVKIWFFSAMGMTPLLLHSIFDFMVLHTTKNRWLQLCNSLFSNCNTGLQALEILTGCYILVQVIMTFASLFRMWRLYIYLHYDTGVV